MIEVICGLNRGQWERGENLNCISSLAARTLLIVSQEVPMLHAGRG